MSDEQPTQNNVTRRAEGRVLAIAYSCEPDRGSEPGAGWIWLREIAHHHPVTLLTMTSEDRKLESAVREQGLDVDIVRVATPLDRIWVDSPLRLLRYLSWLRAAGRQAVELEASGRFFVGHHLTFATSWLPTPLSRLRTTPYIWGPVGGATYPPATLRNELDLLGQAKELLLRTVSRASRVTLVRRTASRASMIVSINRDTAAALARYGPTTVEPNAAFDYASFPEVPSEGDAPVPRALFAGRLLGYKGVAVAIDAMTDPRLAHWRFDVFGAGPDRTRLEGRVRDHGLQDRVVFHGSVDRDTILEAMRSSSVFLFPSMREGGPWAVAEASAMGLKVLCFPLGGSPELAGPNAVLLDPQDPVGSTVAALLDISRRGVPHRVLAAGRIGALCSEWYDAVAR